MNKKIMLVVALVVLLLPFISYAEIEQPELNRTYPYSTHLQLEVLGMPAAPTSCNLTLTWAGDNSTHGDWVYPSHTYDPIITNCALVASGDFSFDVDFDGLYYVNYTNTDGVNFAYNYSSFYVDREEVDGSKVIGAILYPILLLFVCYFLYKLGNSLDEQHWTISALFSIVSLIIMPFAVHISFLVLNEYVKMPSLTATYESLLVILLWGILYVTGAYLLLQVIINLVKKILSLRRKKRGDPRDEY